MKRINGRSIHSAFQDYMKCSESAVEQACGAETAEFTRNFLNKMLSSLMRVSPRWHSAVSPLIDSINSNQAALWRDGNAALRSLRVIQSDDNVSPQPFANFLPNHPNFPIDMAFVSYLIRKLLCRFDYKRITMDVLCGKRGKVMISWFKMCK